MLEKRNSVDGYTYRGRFRIRDVVSFSRGGAPSEASCNSIRSAPVGTRDVPLDSIDHRSDVSEYSLCLAVSEFSEKDDSRNPDDDEGFRENEGWDRQGFAERPASPFKGYVGGGDFYASGDSVETGRGRENSLRSVSETSETSPGNEFELGGGFLVVSSTIVY